MEEGSGGKVRLVTRPFYGVGKFLKRKEKKLQQISLFFTSVRGSEPHLLGGGGEEGPRPPCPGPAR